MDGGDAAPATTGDSGLTDTSSLPIAPVYGGAMYKFGPAVRIARKAFMSEQFYRRPDYGTDIPNPYVPKPMGPRGGIDVQRHMAGTGVPYSDALDLFKPGRLDIDKKAQPVRRPSRPVDPARQRKRGISAYRKMNKANVDGMDV